MDINKIFWTALSVLGLVLIGFAYHFGTAPNEKMEDFLGKKGVAQKMRTAGVAKPPASQQVSPLVLQARAFAERIDPPPPPAPRQDITPRRPRNAQRPPVPRGPAVSSPVKFTLLGTSYYQPDPSQSRALINEVGKGLRWVKQGQNVGHIEFRNVVDGTVTIYDGVKTLNLAVERKQQPRNMIKSEVNARQGEILLQQRFKPLPVVGQSEQTQAIGETEVIEQPQQMDFEPVTDVQESSYSTAPSRVVSQPPLTEEQIAAKRENEQKLLEEIKSDLKNEQLGEEEAKGLEMMAEMLEEALMNMEKQIAEKQQPQQPQEEK